MQVFLREGISGSVVIFELGVKSFARSHFASSELLSAAHLQARARARARRLVPAE